MRIVTVVFDYPGSDTYARCLQAFRASVAANNPKAELLVLTLDPPEPIPGVFQGWINNHVKLKAYSRIPIDQPTVFVDADTIFLRDVAELFNSTFDVAIGCRPAGGRRRVKYNGGVVLFCPTEEARRFMKHWISIDGDMLRDHTYHMIWHRIYNGQNQSSFGCMIEMHLDKTRLQEYPTSVVNACEQDWSRIGKNVPYILHVRKRLLQFAHNRLSIWTTPKHLQPAVRIWRDYEHRGRDLV